MDSDFFVQNLVLKLFRCAPWKSETAWNLSGISLLSPGMTPDLANSSAMWRNHGIDFLRRLIDPRMLRCESGSLCDSRGGACSVRILVSEVSVECGLQVNGPAVFSIAILVETGLATFEMNMKDAEDLGLAAMTWARCGSPKCF
ncbi:hypothetical protein ELI16_14360 [Rhizobium ruizarguesonis]|nr:hypothetical protein ELI16_14360 [Rhizobium ruizarguesonis]